MKPKARSEHLIKQVVGDETLVFDSRDESALRLNKTSSTVWRHCTGSNEIEQIAMLLAAEVALPEGVDAVAVTWKAIEELEGHGLLLPMETAGAGSDFARRDVLRTLAALPIFPSIDKIFAPTLANAASNPPPPTPFATQSHTGSATVTPTQSSSALAVSQSATVSRTATRSASVTGSMVAVSQSVTRTASASATRTPAVTQSNTPVF